LSDVFADTVFWVALVVKRDQHHARALELAREVTGRIVTTQAALLETANFLAGPSRRRVAVALLDRIESRPDIIVISMSDDLWREATQLYRARPDKDWSLTDCASFVAMQDMRIGSALTFDEHFSQAGFTPLMRDDNA
jgi:predicted nucleic acid-binding protein